MFSRMTKHIYDLFRFSIVNAKHRTNRIFRLMNLFQSKSAASYTENYRFGSSLGRDRVEVYNSANEFIQWLIDNESKFSAHDHAALVTG